MTKTPDILIGLPHLGNSALLARAKALNAHVLISANGLSRWRKTSGLREWAGWTLATLANAEGLPPPVVGRDGLVAVLEHLDKVLPAGIRLHGFGVKGAMLSYVGHLWHRLASIDSQAYGIAARHDALRRRAVKSDRLVATHMTRWYRRQPTSANLTAQQRPLPS